MAFWQNTSGVVRKNGAQEGMQPWGSLRFTHYPFLPPLARFQFHTSFLPWVSLRRCSAFALRATAGHARLRSTHGCCSCAAIAAIEMACPKLGVLASTPSSEFHVACWLRRGRRSYSRQSRKVRPHGDGEDTAATSTHFVTNSTSRNCSFRDTLYLKIVLIRLVHKRVDFSSGKASIAAKGLWRWCDECRRRDLSRVATQDVQPWMKRSAVGAI